MTDTAPIRTAELDANVLQHAWIVLTAFTNPDRWEPDRYNCAAFLKAWMAEYRRLSHPTAEHETTDD